MDKIMDDVFCTVDLMENMLEVDDENYCRRGLERRTTKGRVLVLHNREMARAAVLDEQQEGLRDHYKLAKAYQECTLSSTNIAYLMGVSDANIVFAFLKRAKHINTRSEHHHIPGPMRKQRNRLPRKLNSSAA